MRNGSNPSGANSAVRVDVSAPAATPFRPGDAGIVGVFDVDWLERPDFTEMLDTFAASPGTVSGVRFFGAFTAGEPDLFTPDTGGTVWADINRSIDFSATFDALEALTSRGITPFVVLGFFPPAVSATPIQPPAHWNDWQTLVRTFFTDLAADSRFGAEQIKNWWFEVWNEPNEGRFWSSSQADYLALYRATSDAVVSTGLTVRLGGPAIAYKPEIDPEAGAPWLERFLRFVAADPALRCDFISFHRKGTVTADSPDPRRLHQTGDEIARLAWEIDPVRFAGITIINDECDEKVGFEVPYAPRLDHRAAAWLGATTVIHATLGAQYRANGIQFIAAADNANLQLVEAPFDGRRSVVTRSPDACPDLIKLPVFAFYEILRLFGDRTIAVSGGVEWLFPQSDLYHLATGGEGKVASLITYFPDPHTNDPPARVLTYTVEGLPWSRINVGLFQIDRMHSNAYTAAGGSPGNPFPSPDPTALAAIQHAQGLTVARPIRRGLDVWGACYQETLSLEPYTTMCLWITPYETRPPRAPGWMTPEAGAERTNLRWEPNQESSFFSYEVFRMEGDVPAERLSPDPLRAAMWTITEPDEAARTYGVRTISASGVASSLIIREVCSK